MITGLSHATVFVLDQDRAKDFYTKKLGFEVRNDITMGDESEGGGAGFRWLTVGAKGKPDLEIILSDCGMGRDPDSAEKLRSLIAGGSMGIGVMETDDCQQTFKELSAKGVTFLQEPAERPYGIEAVLRDDSGNLISVVQRLEEAG